LCSAFLFAPAVFAQEVRADSDGDGLYDVWETSVFSTDPQRADTDGDGYADWTEIVNAYDPLAKGKKIRKDTDFDADALNDRLELLFGTDLMVADSNGNGFSDGDDVKESFSPTSTGRIPLAKTIVIRLATQRLEQRIGGIVLASYLVSTGKSKTPTPIGKYKVLSKTPKAWSVSAKLWMPYWMHFSGRGHGIHELPIWPGGYREGASHLGRPVSHGCVRLGIGAAKTLYDWAPVGTPIEVVKK